MSYAAGHSDAPEVIYREDQHKEAYQHQPSPAPASAAPYSQQTDASQYPPSSAGVSSPNYFHPDTNQAYESKHESTKRKRICGFAWPKFVLLLVLGIVVIGASVGGAVGGTAAVQRANSSHNDGTTSTGAASSTSGTASTTTGATTTTSQLSVPTAGVIVALNCPSLDGQTKIITLTNNKQFTFEQTCGVDYLGSQGSSIDLFTTTTYTANDCLLACANFNEASGSNVCVAVAFNAQLSKSVADNDGNCWAKNGTGTKVSADVNFQLGAILTS